MKAGIYLNSAKFTCYFGTGEKIELGKNKVDLGVNAQQYIIL